jgi:hypothetical protein
MSKMKYLRMIAAGVVSLSACGKIKMPVEDIDGNVSVFDAAASDATVLDQANMVFSTSALFSGDLGGYVGANQKCQAAATAAGLNQTFVAMLNIFEYQGAPAYNAISVIQGSRGWVRPDGAWVADLPTDFLNGERNAPVLDETGSVLGDNSFVHWTGLSAEGNGANGCENFTSSRNDSLGEYGSSIVRRRILSINQGSCDQGQRLLCLSTGRNVARPTVTVPGKRIFLTRNTFAPGPGGLVNADSLCRNEALAAGLQTLTPFVALLASDGKPSIERITDPSSVYFRVDGTSIGRLGNIAPNTYLGQFADGALSAESLVWTGGAPTTLTNDDCGRWSMNAGTNARAGSSIKALDAAYSSQDVSCGESHQLYCVEP